MFGVQIQLNNVGWFCTLDVARKEAFPNGKYVVTMYEHNIDELIEESNHGFIFKDTKLPVMGVMLCDILPNNNPKDRRTMYPYLNYRTKMGRVVQTNCAKCADDKDNGKENSFCEHTDQERMFRHQTYTFSDLNYCRTLNYRYQKSKYSV